MILNRAAYVIPKAGHIVKQSAIQKKHAEGGQTWIALCFTACPVQVRNDGSHKNYVVTDSTCYST